MSIPFEVVCPECQKTLYWKSDATHSHEPMGIVQCTECGGDFALVVETSAAGTAYSIPGYDERRRIPIHGKMGSDLVGTER